VDDVEDAIAELRHCLCAAMTIALCGHAGACEATSPPPNCPLTREAEYVCYAPPHRTSTAGADTDATSSESDGAATSETEGGTTTATTGEVDTSGTMGEGGSCEAFAAGPPGAGSDASWSGPIADDGMCCFWIDETPTEVDTDDSVCGRPFLVDGHARIAPSVARNDWLVALQPDVASLDPGTRTMLASAWLLDAAAEHASVAAFARFALHLLAIGAPAEFLAETQQAIADELEHARLCYGLAGAYGGHAVGPGPMPVDGALPTDVDLAGIVASAVVEGCVGETLAALQARVASTCACDPVVRAVLARIADDETRHAALAWRFVAWALGRGDARVRDAVREALDSTATRCSAPPRLPNAHGRLSDAASAELRHRGYVEIVLPLSRDLLARVARGGQLATRPPRGVRSRDLDARVRSG
jgi:hypothetical protein